MSEILLATLNMFKKIKSANDIKVGRNFNDFFADRIVQALTEETLLGVIERLSRSVNANINLIGGSDVAIFLQAASSPDAYSILSWLRRFPLVAAMLVNMKIHDDYVAAIQSLDIPTVSPRNGAVAVVPQFQIPITVTLQSPLAHGADTKAGNATMFRRRQVITKDGGVLTLPFFAGNSLRGILRDLLADHFLKSIGLAPSKDKPPIELWFFHALYAGGVLEEGSSATKKIQAALGTNGSIRTDGIRQIRDMLPGLSMLGMAMGNRVMAGRINVGDLRPQCLEWGNGNVPVTSLIGWEFLTRHDDFDGRGEEDDHQGMIATTETLKAGTVLTGGIDLHGHASDLERSALGSGLTLLVSRGYLGANNNRGLGKAKIDICGAPDPQIYIDHLAKNKEQIIHFLTSIGAINGKSSGISAPSGDPPY